MVNRESCNSVSVYVGPVHISTPVYSGDVVLVSVLLYWKSYVYKAANVWSKYN